MENQIKQQTNEILIAHGLDFTIEKAPMFALNKEGKQVESSYFGLINSKTNDVIHICKKGYVPSQNHEVVGLVLKGMEKFGKDLSVTNAGSLSGGRKIFLQLAVEGMSKVANDTIKRFITVIDSNDGTTGLSIGCSDITMRCQNQFFKFYKSGQNKMRHSVTLEEKLKELPFLIESALGESIRQIELYNKFQSTKITKDLAHQMVKHVLGYDRVITSLSERKELSTRSVNIMDKMYSDIETEINQVGENLWGLFGGITRFTTHSSIVSDKENSKVGSLIMGTNYKHNTKALEFCLEQI